MSKTDLAREIFLEKNNFGIIKFLWKLLSAFIFFVVSTPGYCDYTGVALIPCIFNCNSERMSEAEYNEYEWVSEKLDAIRKSISKDNLGLYKQETNDYINHEKSKRDAFIKLTGITDPILYPDIVLIGGPDASELDDEFIHEAAYVGATDILDYQLSGINPKFRLFILHSAFYDSLEIYGHLIGKWPLPQCGDCTKSSDAMGDYSSMLRNLAKNKNISPDGISMWLAIQHCDIPLLSIWLNKEVQIPLNITRNNNDNLFSIYYQTYYRKDDWIQRGMYCGNSEKIEINAFLKKRKIHNYLEDVDK